MTASRDWQPTLAQLRALVAVAHSGSFSTAAAELGVTQSGLSHAVAALETGLECVLLHRTRRGVSLTPAGERVLTRAREILTLTESLPALAAATDDVRGTVRVACFRSVATHVLPVILGRLAAQHPGVRVEVDDGCQEREDVERAVLSGRADLGIAHLPVAERLQVWPLASDAYVLTVPDALALPANPAWSDLDALAFVGLHCSGARRVLDACRQDGLRHEPMLQLREDSSILAMVAGGAAFSILPRLAVEPLPPGVAVRPLPLAQPRPLGVIVLPGVGRQPATRALRRALSDGIRLVPGVARGLLTVPA